MGVDPNRNYGQNWGGVGASSDPNTQSYRGSRQWSEPETQAVWHWSQQHNVTFMMTVHNVAALVLRPPGVHTDGLAPDEQRMKELGDAMADDTGYKSQYGWQLYDTSGTTEDWQYGGRGAGRRGAAAQEVVTHRLRADLHVRPGSARCRWPFGPLDCVAPGDKTSTPDNLNYTIAVPASGHYEWHVTPSTRPFVAKKTTPGGYADTPYGEPQKFDATAEDIPAGDRGRRRSSGTRRLGRSGYAAERRFNVSPAEAAGGVVGQKGGRRGGEAQGGGEAQAHTPLD